MTDSGNPHVSLGDLAYRRLRADIVFCRLAPGARVTEKQLAAETGLSAAPLRGALTRLHHEGLIRTLPRKGYQVAPISPKSIDELFEVWSIIGPEIMSRGVERATPDQIRKLEHAINEMESVAAAEVGPATAVQIIQLLDETFGVFAEAAGNSYLATFFVRLSGEMARVWSLIVLANPGSLDLSGSWMKEILAQRESASAAKSTRQNIKRIHRRVQEIVAAWPSVMDSEVVATGLPASEPPVGGPRGPLRDI